MPSTYSAAPGPIGVFDSGYGGLTILKEIRRRLPHYNYIYLGDNARAPYGTRSFELIFDFTRQAVEKFFSLGCHLVVIACNTASAKALRSIQQQVLPLKAPDRRVLGVIRPTVEVLGRETHSGHVGLLATPGTVNSHSYLLEVEKLYPEMKITEKDCPMWVPLVETGEANGPGADYFVKKYISEILSTDPEIDTLILGCTHYPILLPKIRQFTPSHIRILPQGELVADSLADYLKRHPEIESRCTPGGTVEFLTTETPEKFNRLASLFMEQPVESTKTIL